VTPGAAASRYARALFDVVLKEGDAAALPKAQGELHAVFISRVAPNTRIGTRHRSPSSSS